MAGARVDADTDEKPRPEARSTGSHVLRIVAWGGLAFGGGMASGWGLLLVGGRLGGADADLSGSGAAMALALLLLVTAIALLAYGFICLRRERRRQERLSSSLDDRESRLHDLLAATPDCIFECGPDLRFTFVIGRSAGAWGGSPDRLVGRTLDDLFSGEDGDDDRVARMADVATRSPFRWGLRIAGDDGLVRLIEIAADPFVDAAGRFAGYRGALREVPTGIAASIEAESARRHLRSAIDHMGDGFALFDEDGRLIICNQTFAAGFGRGAPFVVPGISYEDILAGIVLVEPDAFLSGDWAAGMLEAHRRADGQPAEYQAADGRWFQVADHETPLGHIVSLRTDITEAKRIQRELEQRVTELETVRSRLENQTVALAQMADSIGHARDLAEAANKAKTQFLAMMSHELRTPLNAILGFSELLRSQAFGPLGSEQYVDYASDIYSSGVHLLELINDLLDLAKIEAGMLELDEEEVDLSDMFADTSRLVAEQALDREVALEAMVPPDLPPLRADRRKLKQILLNLVSNAVKFTPAGGRVTLRAERERDGSVTIEVADTGIGIAAEDIDRVLEPFVQVDNRVGRQYEGTGLGLPLSRQLVELHDAEFRIESTVGVGTRVTLSFPAERVVVAGPVPAALAS